MEDIIIDGNNFRNLEEFYDEVELKVTKNLDWKIGRNLDAFNDVLRGGFGVYEPGENVVIIWKNSEKSKDDLGVNETIVYLENKLKNCHPNNIPSIQQEFQLLKNNKGQTLFDMIIELISNHPHIILKLE